MWQPESSEATAAANGAGSTNPSFQRQDDVTFGPGASNNGGWDQFAENERLFGVRTHFDENEYTTKLDRTAKDYKEREKRAEQIAAQIIGVCDRFQLSRVIVVDRFLAISSQRLIIPM